MAEVSTLSLREESGEVTWVRRGRQGLDSWGRGKSSGSEEERRGLDLDLRKKALEEA